MECSKVSFTRARSPRFRARTGSSSSFACRSRLYVGSKREQPLDRHRNAVGVEAVRRRTQLRQRTPPFANCTRLRLALDPPVDQGIRQKMEPFRGLIEPAVDDRHRDLRGRSGDGSRVGGNRGDTAWSVTELLADLPLQEAQFRDVDRPPALELLRPIEGDRVDDDAAGIRVPTDETRRGRRTRTPPPLRRVRSRGTDRPKRRPPGCSASPSVAR